MGKCGLTKIPEELFELVWLEELSLSNTYLHWNEKTKQWSVKYSENKGDNNQLSELPQDFSKLKQLKKLVVGGWGDEDQWEISDVSGLSELATLTTLDLSRNQISDTSPLLHFIKKGVEVNLEDISWRAKGVFIGGNPLEKPPTEVIEQGNQAILTYFQDLEQQGEGKLNEAKL